MVSHKLLFSVLITLIILIQFSVFKIPLALADSATYQVNAGANDCAERRVGSPFFDVSGSNYEAAGYYSSTYHEYGSGFRFTNMAIPQGASITNAYLTLYGTYVDNSVTVKTRISADSSDNATIFTTQSDFDSRYTSRTTSRIDWDNIGSWVNHGEYYSVNISSVIQEVINRAGWTNPSSIVIFWEDFDNRATGNRTASPYELSAGYATKLTITWTALTYQKEYGKITINQAINSNRAINFSRNAKIMENLQVNSQKSFALSRTGSITENLGMFSKYSKTVGGVTSLFISGVINLVLGCWSPFYYPFIYTIIPQTNIDMTFILLVLLFFACIFLIIKRIPIVSWIVGIFTMFMAIISVNDTNIPLQPYTCVLFAFVAIASMLLNTLTFRKK